MTWELVGQISILTIVAAFAFVLVVAVLRAPKKPPRDDDDLSPGAKAALEDLEHRLERRTRGDKEGPPR